MRAVLAASNFPSWRCATTSPGTIGATGLIASRPGMAAVAEGGGAAATGQDASPTRTTAISNGAIRDTWRRAGDGTTGASTHSWRGHSIHALTPSGGQVNHWRGRRTRDEAEAWGASRPVTWMTAARTWFLTSASAAFHLDRSGASLKKYVRKGLFLELFSGIVAIIAATFQDEVPFERDDLAGGNPWTWAGDRSAFARSEASPALPRSLSPRSSIRAMKLPTL